MGRGNWIPSTGAGGFGESTPRAYRLVYVEVLPVGMVLSDDETRELIKIEEAYETLDCCLHDNLPDSFRTVARSNRDPIWREFAAARDTTPWFANGMFAVVCDGQGDFWHHGLAVVVREDAPAFAESQLDMVADKLFDALALMYELKVRNGPWTSSPYQIKSSASRPLAGHMG